MTMQRRDFLLAGVGGILAAGVSVREEPELEIVDPHTHFYDPTCPQGVLRTPGPHAPRWTNVSLRYWIFRSPAARWRSRGSAAGVEPSRCVPRTGVWTTLNCPQPRWTPSSCPMGKARPGSRAYSA